MDINFLIALSITLVLTGAIILVAYIFDKYQNVKKVSEQLMDALPTIMDLILGIAETTAPKSEVTNILGMVNDVINKAVLAVEKVSENEEMTSEQKKELAIEFYYQIAKDLKLAELNNLQIATLEILIENAVISMDNLIAKKSSLKEISSENE